MFPMTAKIDMNHENARKTCVPITSSHGLNSSGSGEHLIRLSIFSCSGSICISHGSVSLSESAFELNLSITSLKNFANGLSKMSFMISFVRFADARRLRLRSLRALWLLRSGQECDSFNFGASLIARNAQQCILYSTEISDSRPKCVVSGSDIKLVDPLMFSVCNVEIPFEGSVLNNVFSTYLKKT